MEEVTIPTNRIEPAPQSIAGFTWLLWAGIIAAFTCIVIRYSYTYGKLVVHPFFDDVAYFNDGLLKLQALYHGGLGGLYTAIVTPPVPHSIFSTFLALASYVVFGTHDWSPYAGNAVILLALAGMINVMGRGLPLWQRLLVFLFVLTNPMSAKTIYEFRPDIASALCAAAGAALLVWKPLTCSSWKHRAGASALVGLSMMFKTPTFPLTMFVFIVALGMSGMADIALLPRRPSLKKLIASWIECLAVALLVPLPVYLLQFREIVFYIYDSVFGQHNSMWRTPGTRLWHLLYYFTGEGGMDMLGKHLYLLLAIIAAGLLLSQWLGGREVIVRLVCLLTVTAAAYVLPALMSIKQEFFGSTFDWMLIFAGLYVLILVCRSWNTRVSGGVLIATCIVGLAATRLPQIQYLPGGANSIVRRRIVDNLYAALHQHDSTGKEPVFITTTGYVNDAVLNYLALKQGLPGFNFSQVAFSPNLEDYAAQIDLADLVIASEAGNSEAYGDFIASGNLQDQTLALVRKWGDFEEVAAFSTLTPKRYFLFRRIPPFRGWQAISGMGPLEGPFPDWGLPRVRWGLGPKSVLRVQAAKTGEYELMSWCRAGAAGTTMKILIDGRKIGEHTFANDKDFERFSCPEHLEQGWHEVELTYTKWMTSAEKPMGALFKSMRLVPSAPATQPTQ